MMDVPVNGESKRKSPHTTCIIYCPHILSFVHLASSSDGREVIRVYPLRNPRDHKVMESKSPSPRVVHIVMAMNLEDSIYLF